MWSLSCPKYTLLLFVFTERKPTELAATDVAKGGGGHKGAMPPPPIDRRVKKKVRDWSKIIHITYPTPTLLLHLLCQKCNFDTRNFNNLPTLPLPRCVPPPPPRWKSWLRHCWQHFLTGKSEERVSRRMRDETKRYVTRGLFSRI